MATPESVAAELLVRITLVYSQSPRQVRQWAINLKMGATLGDALEHCGVFSQFPDLQKNSLLLGIWGRNAGLGHVLQDRDRIEIYRPLRVDPKTARRERFDRQGAKGAGLFTRKRPGAKAGY
jgi:putative ubiquitin-RnfH superfamily antitoxin RatB of RatAB toxin-antitoxin module